MKLKFVEPKEDFILTRKVCSLAREIKEAQVNCSVPKVDMSETTSFYSPELVLAKRKTDKLLHIVNSIRYN